MKILITSLPTDIARRLGRFRSFRAGVMAERSLLCCPYRPEVDSLRSHLRSVLCISALLRKRDAPVCVCRSCGCSADSWPARSTRKLSITISIFMSSRRRARSSAKYSGLSQQPICMWTTAARSTFQPGPSRLRHGASFDKRAAAERFRTLLRAAVEREISSARVGAYLSGGTDSSTVAGMLGQITQDRVHTFSIGFDATGYDEMAYARIAAKHFGTEHHEYYVTPADVALGIPVIAAGYDQPFGNSSAVPAFFCAKMAHDQGMEQLLAGDGGDELFGGNVRYARQKVLELYHSVPLSLRSRLIEPLLLGSSGIGRLPVLRKVASYVEQARTSMPGRAEFYNQLARIGGENILSSELLARIHADEPPQLQARIYRAD